MYDCLKQNLEGNEMRMKEEINQMLLLSAGFSALSEKLQKETI